MDPTFLCEYNSNVAIFLKGRFPGLKYLYRYRLLQCEEYDGWWPVIAANGYRGGYDGPGSDNRLRY